MGVQVGKQTQLGCISAKKHWNLRRGSVSRWITSDLKDAARIRHNRDRGYSFLKYLAEHRLLLLHPLTFTCVIKATCYFCQNVSLLSMQGCVSAALTRFSLCVETGAFLLRQG